MNSFKKDFLADDMEYAIKQKLIGILVKIPIIFLLVFALVDIARTGSGISVFMFLSMIVLYIYIDFKYTAKGLNEIAKAQNKRKVVITAKSVLKATFNYLIPVLPFMIIVIIFYVIGLAIATSLNMTTLFLGLIIMAIPLALVCTLIMGLLKYSLFIYPLITGKWNFNPFAGNLKKVFWKILMYNVIYFLFGIVVYSIDIFGGKLDFFLISFLAQLLVMIFNLCATTYISKLLIKLIP